MNLSIGQIASVTVVVLLLGIGIYKITMGGEEAADIRAKEAALRQEGIRKQEEQFRRDDKEKAMLESSRRAY